MLRGEWGWLSLWLLRSRCISGSQLKLCLAYLHTIAQGSTSHPGLMATVCSPSFHTSSGKSPTTRLLLQSLAGMALILRNLFWSSDCSTPLQVVKQQLPFNECPRWQFQLMDTTESPHPCACSLGRSQRKRGADLLDLAFSATAYFFPPVASLPPDFNNAVMYISVPSFQGRKSQGTHVFLVMHCGGLLPRQARGTLSSHRRQDKGGELPDESGLWFLRKWRILSIWETN